MVKGIILADLTDQGRRGIKESPNRAEASIAEAKKLGVNVKDVHFTPGGPHDAAIVIEAEGPEPIHKFMASIQSLGNVKMKFIRAFSIEEMRKMG
ncbi:MAG: GYD domain-containing protein [Deltaproteobacteria bacterium]|nr:GYD domain-containing protein [Deltaproteobacteria bacterium]